jgi:pilus assembly protein Flp/PilA
MSKSISVIKNFIQDEDGQGLVEYGLILGLVSVGAIAALTALKGGLNSVFSKVNTELSTVSGSGNAPRR